MDADAEGLWSATVRRDPSQDRVEIMQRFGFRRGRPAHDDDFDSKRARRFDLGVGRVAAAVLGHQRLHPFVAHKRDLVGERERSALKDELIVGQGVDLRGPVDRPYDVAMLWRSREGGELQTALSQEDRSWLLAESMDGLVDCRDLDPAVTELACPGWAGEDDERRVGRSASRNGVGGHARSERMGRVNDGADALAPKKCDQALDAAEAADALGNWRLSGIGRRPRERQDRRNVGLISKPARKRARLRRAAEDEETKALQWAAP